MIPEKIANAWVTADVTNETELFGYRNGQIIITVQKNGKADDRTVYQAVMAALNDHFKIIAQ